ncbi:MAG TPA: hypothetical protein DDW94_04595 [Deltaproteobacteria bacterium]|nr:MAG: hypothetical protein A2Z79_13050 [Deltaproteobacteria bacterium GWA2_55_82]OGQ62802.1 MAG: hypothetical protein A3I81_11830 [Deltaproteobacteria bacterium RIFCSPLOWO2_02_FULL_55_12]OIJ73522.1 MAG: hypothetical protein A2V21_304120 [Deltaproteobacteria bacterium GWC2_55_46]HBG46253.1 hypothetical protein [Deltaproteobacteria bacterium]HCY10160.1 hypothetical protein [Deltaproteobacteria bacterium]
MKWEYLLILLLTSVIGYLIYLVLAPFFVPVFWAIILVILFHPYYEWLTRKFGGRASLASFAACSSIALFLILPLAILGAALANELLNLYAWAEKYLAEISTRAHQSPVFFYHWAEKYLGDYIDVNALNLRGILASVVRDVTGYIGLGLREFVKSFAELVVNLFLAFFSMFFLFKDGGKLFNLVKDLIPVSQRHKEEIAERNKGVIYATIYGGVLVGAIQAILGGMAFWFLGIPAALVLTFVMFFATFLPSVGASLVWGPVAAYLLITGEYVWGIGLVVWGIFIIGLIDNVLRPWFVSGRTNLHPLLLFFSILGAVNAFGIIGIIAGPLILSICQAMIEFYREYVTEKNTWAG